MALRLASSSKGSLTLGSRRWSLALDRMKPHNENTLQFGRLRLVPAERYRVVQEFQDYDRHVHRPGEEWYFLGYDFLAYDSGYTLYIAFFSDQTGVIRMQDHPEAQERILRNLEQYVVNAQQGAQADSPASGGPAA